MPTLLAILVTKVKRSQVITLVILGASSVLIGAWAFSVTQHLSFGTGLYWAFTTASTVGYGDVTPHNSIGRVIAVAVMVTAVPLFGAAFALLAASATAARLGRLLHVGEGPPKGDFVAIYGAHATVARIASEVALAGESVVVIADHNLASLPSNIQTIEGDPTLEAVLRKSHPERASRLLIAAEDDKDALIIGVLLRHLAPATSILAVVQSARIAAALIDLGVSATVSAEELLGHTLAKSIETPHAAALLLELVSSKEYRFEERSVPDELVGMALSRVRAEHDGLVLGLVHDNSVDMGIALDPVLVAGDQLLLLSQRV
ncbi:MAG: ion channel [Ferrimicrobium sp.]